MEGRIQGGVFRVHHEVLEQLGVLDILRVREHGDAEDLTQTVFLKLPRAIARYDSCALPFERWLLRLARDSALEHVTCSARGETVWVSPRALVGTLA